MIVSAGQTQTSSSTPASVCGDRVTRLKSNRSERKHVSGNKRFVLKLGVCFLYLVALHNAVSTTFKCAFTLMPMNVLDAVSVACRTFFAALTSHLYCRSYPDIVRFLSRDRKLDPGLHQELEESPAVRRKRWLAYGLVGAYGVALAVHQCVWLHRYGPLVYFRSQLYNLDPVALRMRPSVVAFSALVDFTAFNVAVLVPAFCMAHYVTMCDLLVLKVRRLVLLKSYCVSGGDGIKASTVRKLQTSYAALKDAVQFVDKNLRAAVFIWYVDTVLNIVVSVRSVQHTLAHFNAYSASGAYVHAAYLAAAFLLVSLSAANLVAQRRHLLHDMCRLVCAIGTAEDDELCNQVMLLQEDVANGQLAFTGWDCFDIDRPLILSVMGAVITYSVVLRQLT
ncbi:hypothetical protein HPB51_026091 [Rhipicephalus microplus]|uniref:Gustatory receptor n=1 Tax=Rhipicephalus microplus TaxID=6941 RepID=A0A9J6EE63_RHIMP|nr:hypothetical protein HPB51_026091 [Rhipicephalus microplus]